MSNAPEHLQSFRCEPSAARVAPEAARWPIVPLFRSVGGEDAPPRLRIFGVGAAKTGTHSFADMFAHAVPSAHEPEARRAISHILMRRATGSRLLLRNYLRARDARLNLTVDASQLNIYIVRELVELFPESRFVLTVRHPTDWLRSMIDDSLRREIDLHWRAFRLMRFGRAGGHPPEEEPLARRGLHTLSGYLSYWRFAIEEVEWAVPGDRLLVVDLPQLSGRQAEIARFCGLDPCATRREPVVRFSNPKRFGVLEELARDYLTRVVERECGALLSRYFPGIDAHASVERVLGPPVVPQTGRRRIDRPARSRRKAETIVG